MMNKNMQPEAHSSKALSKEEIRGLLTLVEGSTIISNKKTNAANNKIKNEEWVRIANTFNACIGICHRTPQQLRLKWENLKKNCRRRSAAIRMDRIKTGGRSPGYFPPDEILDRVAVLLDNTGKGLIDMSGENSDLQIIDDGEDSDSKIIKVMPDTSGGGTPFPKPINDPLSTKILTLPMENVDNNDLGNGMEIDASFNINANSIVPNNERHFISSGVKTKILNQDDGRYARNIALAEYYTLKKKVLETKLHNSILDKEKLKLENEKLKLDNEKLKFENEKLKFEIEKLKFENEKLKLDKEKLKLK